MLRVSISSSLGHLALLGQVERLIECLKRVRRSLVQGLNQRGLIGPGFLCSLICLNVWGLQHATKRVQDP